MLIQRMHTVFAPLAFERPEPYFFQSLKRYYGNVVDDALLVVLGFGVIPENERYDVGIQHYGHQELRPP